MQAIPSVFGFLPNLSPVEMLVLVFIVLLLFGAKRLPELGRSMGKFVREFKKTTTDIEEDIRSSLEDTPAASPAKAAPAKTNGTEKARTNGTENTKAEKASPAS